MGRTWRIAAKILSTFLATAAAAQSLDENGPEWQPAARALPALAEIRVGQQRYCTAVLIAPDLAMTAAHCVSALSDPAELSLVFGASTQPTPLLRGVRAWAVSPDYRAGASAARMSDLASDLALLALKDPVSSDEAEPIGIADWDQAQGDFVDILGYEREGAAEPTLREGCMVLQVDQGVARVNCDVVSGMSGAPVLLETRPDVPLALVALVSSRGQGAAYVVEIKPRLKALQAMLAKELAANGTD